MRQLRLEVANGLVELKFPRDSLGQKELTAELSLAFEQDHVRTKSGTLKRSAHARRTAADHCNPPAGELFAAPASAFCGALRGFWSRNRGEIAFVTGPRVDQARRHLLLEHMVQARLIASNAGVDVLGTRQTRLLDQMGIGQKRPGHADHVGTPLCQGLLTRGRIVEAVGGDQGNVDRPHEFLRDKPESTPGHHCGNGWDSGFMPPDARVDDVRPGVLHTLGKTFDFFPIGAASHQVQHA